MENITEKAIVPYNPSTAKVLQKEKYNLFAPIAKNGAVGMAAFNTDHFTIDKDVVDLTAKIVAVIESLYGPDCDMSNPSEDSTFYELGSLLLHFYDALFETKVEILTLYDGIEINSSDINIIKQRLDVLEEALRVLGEILEDVDTRVKKIETTLIPRLLYEGEFSIRSVIKGETSYSSGVYAEAVIVNNGGTDV